jgi:WD40 repeat protein
MNTLSPRRTLVTTFSPGTSSYDDGAYILHIATSNESSSFVTCALSDQSVRVIDREKFEPRAIISQAHTAPITDLCHVGDSLVVSSGYDGFVKLFDLRMAPPAHSVLELKLPNREQALSTSVGYGGTLAAVGSAKSKIHFFDLRAIGKDDRRIGCYVDAHTDEVTKVRFQACFGIHDSSLLVSASEDGLACIHDTRQTTEENALVSVMNLMNPIREVGFFGPSGEGLFCLTGSETMSVWHHDSAQRIYDFGSIRDNLALKCEFSIDYLVNCYWDNVGMNLNLLAGNSSGDAAIFHVDVGSISLSKRLLGGHKGCIRALCPTTMHQNILYTVGEDSRLCEWLIDDQREEMSLGEHNSPELSSNTEKQSTVGPVRKPKSKHTHKPY